MRTPSRTALGAWGGGRFMHFGEPIADDRLVSLLRPDDAVSTVITADVYGEGGADRLVGSALEGLRREDYSLVGAVGHDFYEGERDGPKGFPRFTDARLRGADQFASYLRMATERSLERCGVDSFDLLLLHNPDRTGYTSEAVWDGMGQLKQAGLTASLGIAPGPANGFTLDLISCFERFGTVIDWAMIILNPLEPWPGELCMAAAAQHGVSLITRVVDYGGIFWDDVRPGHRFAERDHRKFRPQGWVRAGCEKLDAMRPIAERHSLTPIQLACQWNLGHTPVACTVPTLIQELGADARPIESKRADLAALSVDLLLTKTEIAEIGMIGDNANCMTLKGASPDYSGAPSADRWQLDDALRAAAERWAIEPERNLTNSMSIE